MRARSARSLVPVVLALVLVAVVAVSATGTTPTGSSDGRRPSEYVLDTFLSLALLLLLPGAALLVYGLMQRREISREIASGRHKRTSVLGFAIFLALFTTVIYWARERGGLFGWGDLSEVVEIGPDGRIVVRDPSEGDPEAYRAEIAWIPVLLVLALGAAAVLAYVLAGRRRRGGRAAREAAPGEELADVLDETLDDLRAEPDPRRAVVAAFARLERALGAVGVPKARAETAEEYVGRALDVLEVRADAIQRLTVLYERAQFSQHRIDEAMREAAIDALADVRDGLLGTTREPALPAVAAT